MSKKMIALLIMLTALCAYVNRGLIFGDESSTNEEYEESEDTDTTRDDVEADGSDSESQTKTNALDSPDNFEAGDNDTVTPLTKSEPSQRLTDEDRNAVILASLSRRIAERERLDQLEIAQDPFVAVVPQSRNLKKNNSQMPSAYENENRDKEDRQERIQREAAKEALLQMKAKKRAEIASIAIHAIIRSKKTSMVRIRQRNLRVGDTIPETAAVVAKIASRHIVVRFDGEEIVIPLTHGKRVRRKVEEPESSDVQEARATPAPTLLLPPPGTQGTTSK